jgi:hypothetical protein
MVVRRSYSCNICGVERKTANHWFVATQGNGYLHIVPWHIAEREGKLNDDNAIHLCGQVCAHKLLDRFLTLTEMA